MKNTESVAESFEKTADQLAAIPTPNSRVSEIVSLKAFLRTRADQVRAGQLELDRAKALLAEIDKES